MLDLISSMHGPISLSKASKSRKANLQRIESSLLNMYALADLGALFTFFSYIIYLNKRK